MSETLGIPSKTVVTLAFVHWIPFCLVWEKTSVWCMLLSPNRQ